MGSIPIRLTNLAEIDPVFERELDNFPALSTDNMPLNFSNLDLLAYGSMSS